MSKGGMLWGSDWDRLAASARRTMKLTTGDDGHYVAVEIGVNDGRTSRDLMEEIGGTQKECDWAYIGIDPVDRPSILEGSKQYIHHRSQSHIIARHAYRNSYRPSLVIVDGCHCFQCVVRDAILYGNLLRKGGELLFHDASPRTQGLDSQDYPCMKGYHDETTARDRGIDVRRALDSGFLAGFELVEPAPDQERGGFEIYRKVSD